MSRRNETRLFHARLSTTSIHNGHQTTTVTTTSHRSREMTVSLGPPGTLVTCTKTKSVTVKSISETRVVKLRLRCLNERATLCGQPSVLVTGFYGACYFVGMFVTGVPIEARYSVVSVCNEL
jgi:hypothetical protein